MTVRLTLSEQLDRERLQAALPRLVEEALPAFLPSRRWFGDKSRTITGVTLRDVSIVPVAEGYLALALLSVAFDAGEPADYFAPLLISKAAATEPLAEIEAGGERWTVSDALTDRSVHRWLLDQLDAGASFTGTSGKFVWEPIAASAGSSLDAVDRARGAETRVSAAEQSNTSIVYGTAVILKVFRRVQPGLNPEAELGRFLTTRGGFRHTPALLGTCTYVPNGGEPYSLAVAQEFVENIGDGWSFVVRSLTEPESADVEAPRRLGELTAQLHLALSNAPWDPALAPETITADDVRRWAQATESAIEATAAALSAKLEHVDGETRDLIQTFLQVQSRLRAQTAGYERLRGRAKTRVHGDYHLGQTLRTTDGDFVILDFEGEPRRPIHERRAKTSPLKDVAGMLRSFSYARGAAERVATSPSGQPQRAALIAWERAARRAFLNAYVSESRRGGAPYLPASDDDIRQAVMAWELDKALYEINYELNNRPDWLRLPLASVLKYV
ncbi:MAG TPA: phosphotransferase [Thermomicrobiales bacterium]